MRWAAVASQIAIAAQSATPATQRASAQAAESRPRARREVSRVPTSSIRGEAYAGYAGSMTLGADFLMRYRLLEGGALCQWQWVVVALNRGNVGCGLGLGVAPRGTVLGVDLLGVLGARHWQGVGSGDFLSGNPGASETLPFAGVRAGVSFHVHPVVFGIWLGLDDDLGRKHVTYTYDRGGLLGPSVPAQGAADVGAVTWLAAWRTGLEYDLP